MALVESASSVWQVQVKRRGWRAWLVAGTALVAIAFAFDLAFTYRVFPEPEANEEGVRTSQGDSDRRADLVWAVGLALAGAAGLGWSGWTLSNRQALSADTHGLELDLGERVAFSWHDIEELRSAVVDDDFGQRHVLHIDLIEAPRRRPDLNYAEWAGPRTLLVDADDWSPPLHIVATRLATLFTRAQHVDE